MRYASNFTPVIEGSLFSCLPYGYPDVFGGRVIHPVFPGFCNMNVTCTFGPSFAINLCSHCFIQQKLIVKTIISSLFLLLLSTLAKGQQPLSQTKSERLYQKGTELIVHDNYGAARKVFSEFLEEAPPNDPRRGEAEYYLAFSALNLNHTDGEKLIDQYISNHPSSPKAATAYYDLAFFLLRAHCWNGLLQGLFLD